MYCFPRSGYPSIIGHRGWKSGDTAGAREHVKRGYGPECVSRIIPNKTACI